MGHIKMDLLGRTYSHVLCILLYYEITAPSYETIKFVAKALL